MCIVSKEIRINVRTTAEIKRDIEIAARLRGLTVSSLINSLAVKAIREERDREPEKFAENSNTKITPMQETLASGELERTKGNKEKTTKKVS